MKQTTEKRIKLKAMDFTKLLSTPVLAVIIYTVLNSYFHDIFNGILFSNMFNMAITATAALALGDLFSKVLFIRGTIEVLGNRFDNERPEGAGHIDVVRTVNDKMIKSSFGFSSFLSGQAVALGLTGTILGLSSATASLSTAMSGASELSFIKEAIGEMLSVGLATAFDSTLLAMAVLLCVSTLQYIVVSILMRINASISHDVEFRGYKPGQD